MATDAAAIARHALRFERTAAEKSRNLIYRVYQVGLLLRRADRRQFISTGRRLG